MTVEQNPFPSIAVPPYLPFLTPEPRERREPQFGAGSPADGVRSEPEPRLTTWPRIFPGL